VLANSRKEWAVVAQLANAIGIDPKYVSEVNAELGTITDGHVLHRVTEALVNSVPSIHASRSWDNLVHKLRVA
jgi:hypothetical protein